MSVDLQQLKQATKRKSNGLFFIKSKHACPTFKNHEYFEMRPKNSLINQTRPTDNKIFSRWKMFVNEPSGYGIENTFRYMCNQIRLSNRKNSLLNMNIKKNKIQAALENAKRHHSESRKRAVTLQQAPVDDLNNTLRDVSPHGDYSIVKEVLNNARLATLPTNKYLENTQCFNYRIRKSKLTCSQFRPQQKSTAEIASSGDPPASHIIQMTYVFGGCQSFYNDSNTQSKISFNILPFILNCFFKCKINYSKNFNQSQYNTICDCIQQIKSSTKYQFDVKDIISVSTVKQLLDILNFYGRGSLQWIETVRYFFMPHEEVLNYQYKKLMDEIKIMTILKFNIEIIDQQLYIYRLEDKCKINNIYDLLKPGTYIYSQNKAVYETYCRILKKRAEIYSYNNRIKRWRSVAPLDENQNTKYGAFRDNALIDNEKMSLQKFNKLFQITKKKRNKSSGKKCFSNTSVGSSVLSPTNGSFIDKSKLHNSQDIFE